VVLKPADLVPGTAWMLMPVALFSISMVRCSGLPMPVEP